MREPIHTVISNNVRSALSEDIASGDITALLIDERKNATANVIIRENAIISGTRWVNETFLQVDPATQIEWHVADGDQVITNQRLFTVTGSARSLLTAERTALNFLQTLSATATITAYYARILESYSTKILDTRKTLPGLRIAQKQAVLDGGGTNHRIGLDDAFLIKENHILSCGSIKQAVSSAKKLAPGKPVEVEVESLIELAEALNTQADIIMLDNFDLQMMQQAVSLTAGRAKLEASGEMTPERLAAVASTGVDYISSGSLTKHIQSINLSMRFK
ncbi:Nicotinate-nucleotide pyrophosphorylase [carboxylating] [Piscirickettsia salmonis]|uniref:Probable nicotinate-nucleotide pyrophosphorylase [carboxylating] n=1 Tax=Piscirickettsia salmonis TaxID=1238 RepID=A0A1L6TF92_PISSA|nr:carboxylating nicotinate-nucleotide diphosphorylase [Piscirickettsia salmonis]AKP72425.1 nicotinate-nucleotide pyrophosphorylase [Piscirickettsia salmonis LF-89 = ATCC VR-1361]ALB24113.1 nicotinate-nucleotide diphosphorylase [Piscirickettsia salmonis]ALY03921.1 nicotinate-nucleotide pyrophosphorylase [Piscirickettsia salmonis]AMA43482.1 nicotinate-nucleotide pyrophosphorylase [Piscirickettsia salmonis]AOS35951.1 nicotinate-nucleotide pyrophosphorylase [Piscirickettsia salmonis]